MSVTSSVVGGLLTVSSDADDAIAITSDSGALRINGADPDSGPETANNITQIVVNGGPQDNSIDLSGVQAGDFATLTSVSVNGGDGNDSITGSEFADSLSGGQGDDSILAGPGTDTVLGGSGRDRILGQAGDDDLQGEGDDDHFVWENNDGSDIVEGGSGSDRLDMRGDDSGDDILVAEVTGRVEVTRTNLVAATLDLGGVERLDIDLGDGNDILTVEDLSGSDLNDLNPFGGLGDDVFVLADGSSFGNGTGAVDGGDGTNTLDYSNYTSEVQVNLSSVANFLSTLNELQEVPPTGSIASGSATLSYNLGSGQFNLDVQVSGIALEDVSGFHIHAGQPGENGPIIFNFAAAGIDFVQDGADIRLVGSQLDLPAEQERALLVGDTYFNLHTTDFPAGEIRGQINVQSPAGFGTGASGISNVNVVFGGSGSDALDASEISESVTLQGNGGPDSLSGGSGDDSISGGANNDTLVGGGGADRTVGDAGSDRIVWNNGDGDDVVEGGADQDVLELNGSSADDSLELSSGGGRASISRTNQTPFELDADGIEQLDLNGANGNDIFSIRNLSATDLNEVNLFGGTGDDLFLMHGGADLGTGLVDGGDGTNTLDYSNSGSGVNVALGNDATLDAALNETQEVPPSGSNATGDGSFEYNTVTGLFNVTVNIDGSGDITSVNEITGFHLHRGQPGENGPIIFNFTTLGFNFVDLGGDEFLLTASGLIFPEAFEHDLLAENTYFNLHTTAFPDGEIRGQLGVTQFPGTASGTGGIANIQGVIGSSNHDVLIGSTTPERFEGRGGNDSITANAGNDTVAGNAGDDTINAGAGNDQVTWSSGDGNDLIDGGPDTDSLVVTGAAINEDFLATIGGSRVDLQRTNGVVSTLDIGTVESLDINAGSGDDSLTVDFGGGSDLNDLRTIEFDGEGQISGDSLALTNGSATSIVHQFTNATDGRVDSGTTWSILYTGLEPIADDLDAVDRVFTFNDGGSANDITLSDDPVAGDSISVVSSVSSSETVLFKNPTNSLTINAQGGADVFTFTGIDTAQPATIIFNGGDGNDAVDASASSQAITINGQAGADTVVGSGADDLISGGTGGDSLAGGGGDDTVNGDENADVILWNDGDGDDVIDGGDATDQLRVGGSDQDDDFTLENGATSRFILQRSNQNPFSLDVDVETLEVNGRDGNDSLTVDFAGASDLDSLQTVTFNGQGPGEQPGDSLAVVNGSVTTVTHSLTDASSGTVTADATVINYNGLEPVLDNLDAINRVFNFNNQDNIVTISDDDNPSDGISRISSVASSETVTFAHPTGTLTVTTSEGNDTVLIEGLDDGQPVSLTVNGGAGNDTLDASAATASVTLAGGGGDDLVRGGAGDDSLEGSVGNDTLDGNRGADAILGGADADLIVWNAGDGNDTIVGGTGQDTQQVNGSNLPDRFVIDAILAPRLRVRRTSPQPSTLDIETVENLEVRGNHGDDSVRIDQLDAVADLALIEILGGAGNDDIDGSKLTGSNPLNVNGGPGRDLIRGGEAADELLGAGGNDTLFGGARADKISGGGGNDQVNGGGGSDLLQGQSGNDELRGNTGDDTLEGAAGNDELRGGRDNDRLLGQAGTDKMMGQAGNDFLSGGPARDILHGGKNADTLVGGSHDDRLFGDDGNDLILGNAGNDQISGGSGLDILRGGAGSDNVDGGADSDRIFGDEGNDRLFGADGNDTVRAGSGNDSVEAGSGRDAIFGGSGSDLLRGDQDRDLLRGGTGNDVLHGGADNDRLLGELGDDRLLGELGNDTLIGGPGDDVLSGGPGSNVEKP